MARQQQAAYGFLLPPQDVRSDSTETNWVALGYEGKNKIILHGTGTGGHAELMQQFTPDIALFCLLRLTDGDKESVRIKFVFIVYVGDNVGAMAKGRVTTHLSDVKPMFGQFNIELRADNAKECSEDIMRRKLKVAGGADYDTGSNAAGYKSSGNIKAKALESYGQKVRRSA